MSGDGEGVLERSFSFSWCLSIIPARWMDACCLETGERVLILDTVLALVTGGTSRATLVAVSLFSCSLLPTEFECVLEFSECFPFSNFVPRAVDLRISAGDVFPRTLGVTLDFTVMSFVEAVTPLATLLALGERPCSLGL